MIKTNQPITSINDFHIGDKVRLKDGDGRPHIIKSFDIDGLKEFFFEVYFEDGTKTMLDNILPLSSNQNESSEEPIKTKNNRPCKTKNWIASVKAEGGSWIWNFREGLARTS